MSRFATPRDLVPEAHCVMGTMLRPFSLGHHLLLTKVGAEPLTLQRFDASTLALAVFICAARPSDTEASIIRGDWESDHKQWLRQLKPRFWQRARFQHDAESKRFSEYLQDGYRGAPTELHEGSLKVTSPWECWLEGRLVSGGYDRADVLEMYLPAAWYRFYALFEMMQADNITDMSRWRRVFWTEQMEMGYRRQPTN